MSKVVVTGGAGFIGSNLVRLLLEEGHEITVLDNISSGYSDNIKGLPIEFVKGDVRDRDIVHTVVKGADTIFHLAASVGNTRAIEHPIEDSEINVLGTLQILEGARNTGVRKVVFSSSAGIFGELKHLPIKEDHPVEPDSPYGASKLGAEKHCLAYAKLYDLEAVCLRYFNVYGIRQRYDAYGNVIPIFAHKMLNGEPITIFGDGEQTRDFVNVRDVARANMLAGKSVGVSGAFNIASATSITINDLVALMHETLTLEGNVHHGPERPGDVRHSLADISAAHAAIGFQPTVTLEQGMPEYLEWASGVMV